jgi:hypothetical protein
MPLMKRILFGDVALRQPSNLPVVLGDQVLVAAATVPG